jgi:glutamate decarboxylase
MDDAMPLHDRDAIGDRLEECCVFAGHSLSLPVPKYRFPADQMAPKVAFQVISDELILDGNARQNLATFCQTWAGPELLALMELSFNKNMMDKDEYPQTAEIERRCVHMLADLWHAPDAVNTIGASPIGSSEACMLAGLAAKWRWRDRQRAAGHDHVRADVRRHLGHGLAAARRLRRGRGPLRAAPGPGAAVRGGGRQLQSPLTSRAGW